VRGLLGRIDGNPVLADLQARAQRLAWFGALNSLAVAVLKFSSPGVPDIYQGTELVELSLVDPDNRRPVDYALRERLLAELQARRAGPDLQAALAAMARSPTDGRLKLWLAWRLLALRQADPALFEHGRYLALRVVGPRRRHVVAFARRAAHATLLVMVGRKFASLGLDAGTVPVGAALWDGTLVRRPDGLASQPLRAVDVLSEREFTLAPGPLSLADHFVHFPAAALLIATPSAAMGDES
jgi:(1->4)-alpha-D-glucan 1-alpha-D-glucosylmutase